MSTLSLKSSEISERVSVGGRSFSETKRFLTEDEMLDVTDFLQVDPEKDWETSISVLEENRKDIFNQLKDCKIYPSKINKLKEKLKSHYDNSKIEPGTAVGPDASLAIGEPTTQLTLNSIDFKEYIVVKSGKFFTCPKIGEFIDKIMIDNKDDIVVYDGVTDYVDINFMNLETPCVDENGKMHWKKIEAVTRHPPPGGNKLLEVKTQTGRRVAATKAKSFLLRRNNKIVGVNGSELKVGDRLPVTIKFPRIPEEERVQSVNLSRYISKEEFVFGTDLWRARELCEEYKEGGRSRWKEDNKERKEKYSYGGRNPRWWTDNFDIEFTLPYHRSDTAMDALNGKKKETIGNEIIKKEFVYTTKRALGVVNELPEEIELDEEFGFIVGIYVAEGCCSPTQFIISNNDEGIRKKVEKWCDKRKIGYHLQIQHDKNFKGATSSDVRVHSTLLVEWFTNMCGNGSGNKHLPDFTLFSNDKFIKGLIDGYFSGDGSVDKHYGTISCSSISESLIDELAMVLNMYDIFCYKSIVQAKKNNIGSLDIKPGYVLHIQATNANRFYKNFSLSIDYKQKNLELNKDKKYRNNYYHNDVIPGIECKKLNGEIHRDKLEKMIYEGIPIDSMNELYNAIDTEVLFDKIISIEEVDSSTQFVYDLTVSDTRNFSGRDGLAYADTFHNAGVSAANVTLGVPRTNEILNASKNQKTNILNFSLNPRSTDLKNLQIVRNKCRETFEERYVDQCIVKHEILKSSPSPSSPSPPSPPSLIPPRSNRLKEKYTTPSAEDKIWYDLFDQFYTTHYKECEWGIRLHLNKLVMVQYNISTEKIARKIETEYKDCRCVFSPNHIAIVDIYIDTTNVDTPSVILSNKKKLKRRGKNEKKEKENPKSLINDDNKDYYFVSRVALEYILDIKVCGIEGIVKAYYQLDNNTKNWKIETAGTNMREVMNCQEVDYKTVISNNMWEIFGILGIEATRKFLISEIASTISFGGTFIDPTHPSLLADSMTSTGTITSVNRYGISKSVVGVLTPASFEQSHQNMLDAPTRGVTDDLSTVSANIITGKHITIGTGYFGLFLDRNKLKHMDIPPPPVYVENKDEKKEEEKVMKVVGVDVDKRFPSSNAVFKNEGRGTVVEKIVEKVKPKVIEYIDF